VTKAVGANVGEPASELMKSITPANVQSWTQTEPKDWANEPFAFADRRKPNTARDRGVLRQAGGRVTIDAAYVQANAPIVREQLQKAGVRVGHMLDAALAK
jgi:hypothetical protein